jgi:hypothetical protein
MIQAQNLKITGQVLSENDAPATGASIALQHPWGELVKGTTADANGNFTLEGLGKGGFTLKITFLGYLDQKKQITLTNADVALGVFRLKPDPQLLKEAVVTDKIPMAVQKGDTMEFNAGAFKVLKDADAQDLIEKIPTVTTENGTVKAQGETVQQVLVDGKPFFGNDPSAAMRNLPAEVIEKVQIFDAQSDQSQFTGFNDGTTVKTINIVTKNNMRNGQFGKIYGGYGYEDKYQLGGNINYFDGDRRISLIGLSNNINVQNFAAEDILSAMGGGRGGQGGGMRMMGGMGGGGRGPMGGGQGGNRNSSDFLVQNAGGISTTHAIGLNYSDKWGKKTEVSGSYFFNNSHNITEELLYRQFLANETGSEVYDENSTTNTDNLNHRMNLRLEYQIDSSNSILFRPRLTIQQNNSQSITQGTTRLSENLLNRTENTSISDRTGYNLATTLLYRHKFSKKGRTVSIDVSPGYAPKKNNSSLYSYNTFNRSNGLRTDSLDQIGQLEAYNWNAAANLEYTEPLSPNKQLLLNYRYSYQQESSDKYTYNWLEASNAYNQLDTALSNVFSNDYITQQAGIGYNYSRNREINLSMRVNAQWASLQNEQTFPTNTPFQQTFFNILPSANLRYTLNKSSNLNLSYRSNTQLPSVDQLQEVVDNSNPLQLTVGNPTLKQSAQHNVSVRYQRTDVEKSNMLFAVLSGGVTNDYIANSTIFASRDNPIFADLNIQPGAQLTLPVNLDGYYNIRSFMSYGVPIKKIKTNFSLDVGYTYSRTPGLLNEVLNYANTHQTALGVSFTSNISTRVDFTISTRPSYNKSFNTLQSAQNAEYLNQNSRFKLNWIIYEGFVLRTDVSHQLYTGLSDDFNQQFWLWNLGIGKKMFKNERGEITLAINDLLNQNRNVRRTVTESYIDDTQTNALTRFVMLSFTYQLRHFRRMRNDE